MATAGIEQLRAAQFSNREIVGSWAFNIERESRYTNAEMRADIISYLSEYRLCVQKYDYELLFSYRQNEGFKIRDAFQGEAMTNKAIRAIKEREKQGDPIHRELAEFEGMKKLEKDLPYAQNGDSVFWISPPGPKDLGYGDYGFFYAGRVVDTPFGKKLAMTAIRIEKPTITECNMVLSSLTGDNIAYISAQGFLANPKVSKGQSDVDAVLQNTFSFELKEEENILNKKVIMGMGQMIDDFIVIIRTGTKEEKVKAFHALENYALELKERYKKRDIGTLVYINEYRQLHSLVDIISTHGFTPPTVAGSCGSTKEESTQSNNILANGFDNLMKAIFGNLKKYGIGDEEDESYNFNTYGDCVICAQKTMVGPCDICKPCDENIRAKNSSKAA